MKQILIRRGKVQPYTITEPTVKRGFVKIAVHYSTISVGTEVSTIKGSGKSIITRAIENPQKVIDLLSIFMAQGVSGATNKLNSAVESLSSIGYSIAGQVLEVGHDVDGFAVGDYVSAGGSGFAVHAGVVSVPKNLVVKCPVGLSMKFASTGTVGAIALHGVRRADLRIGEYAVVYGVGLLGLLSLQILKASGIKVACVDISNSRLDLAKTIGADLVLNSIDEDAVNAIQSWTRGQGADAVLFTASTEKDEPLSQAFRMCRRKGRVVLVGVSGMNIDRNDIYRNEIDLLISSSYGPGRYDDNYELKGNDYPYAYVRWTENRNIEAYLDLVLNGHIDLEKLMPKEYDTEHVQEAFSSAAVNPDSHILTFLRYIEDDRITTSTIFNSTVRKREDGVIRLGVIGTGSFAMNTLLPIISKHSGKYHIESIHNSSGDKALNAARLFNSTKVVSNPKDVLNDPDVNLVMISTRHGSHASLVMESLRAGKHVFVEKPLAVSFQEIGEIEEFYNDPTLSNKPLMTVGFNRRYSRYSTEVKRLFSKRSSPGILRYRMNAGFVSNESWLHEDGGRIVGEACHIIDLMQFLTDSEVTDFSVAKINPHGGKYKSSDNRTITLSFTDGSIGTIDYFSCGGLGLMKEYMEVHYDSKTLVLNDYKELLGYGVRPNVAKSQHSLKGHEEEWIELYHAIHSGEWPISFSSLLHTSKLSILISQ